MRTSGLLHKASIVLAASLLAGCVTETRKVEGPQVAYEAAYNEDGEPRIVQVVPQQMQDLSGDLLRYHVRYRRLPASLQMLVDSGITDSSADLSGYLYHPRGLCVLDDGRTVLLADNGIRLEDHLWCVVREPSDQPRNMTLNVTPVAINQLQQATRQAE